MRNAGEKRLQNLVTFLCTLVFAVFSFAFIAVYKSAEIEVVYDYVATGRLNFNAYLVSGIATAILSGLALWLNRFAGFRREWTAMAFLPSSLILAFVTDIDRSIFVGGVNYVVWLWVLALGLLFFFFSSFVLNRVLFEKIKDPSMAFNRIMWRNLIFFVLLFIGVGYLSGGDKNFRREALQYKFLKAGDVDAALSVGKHSPVASRQFTAQRAFLLSLKGALAENFFEYPVYAGSESLLPSIGRDAPIESDTIYSHIGISRNEGECAIDYLARAVADENNAVAREFYLTALLADRRLVDFADKVFEFYNTGAVGTLPKHFKEALLLYVFIVPEFGVKIDEPEMAQRFAAMVECARGCGSDAAASYLLYPSYGDTYWWYFLYGD